MTLGTALLIIAVLYLIERHHLWKIVGKAAAVAVVVALLAGGAYWGWSLYHDRKVAAASGTVPIPPGATIGPASPRSLTCRDLGPGWESVSDPKAQRFDADGARKEGYSQAEIDDYLAARDPYGYPVCRNTTTGRQADEYDFGVPPQILQQRGLLR